MGLHPCIGSLYRYRYGTGAALLIRGCPKIYSSLRPHWLAYHRLPDMLMLALLISAPAALGMATPIVIDHSSARHVPLRTPSPWARPLVVGKSIQLWELPKQAGTFPTRLLARCLASASPRDVTLAGVATNILLSGMKVHPLFVHSCPQLPADDLCFESLDRRASAF